MTKFTTFRIPLKGAAQGTVRYEFLLDDNFFRDMESNDILGGAVNVILNVKHTAEANYFNFSCQGTISIPCNRCLEAMSHEVDTEFQIAVKFGDEYNDEADDVLIIPNSETDLNVASLIYDTVALTIPIQHVHPEGECDEDTWEALQAHTATDIEIDDDGNIYSAYDDEDGELSEDADNSDTNTDSIDPRWAELLKLKDNNLKKQ